MNENLKDAIESYVELLEKLARRKNLTTEQAVKELVTIGAMMTKERTFMYEINNEINPKKD